MYSTIVLGFFPNLICLSIALMRRLNSSTFRVWILTYVSSTYLNRCVDAFPGRDVRALFATCSKEISLYEDLFGSVALWKWCSGRSPADNIWVLVSTWFLQAAFPCLYLFCDGNMDEKRCEVCSRALCIFLCLLVGFRCCDTAEEMLLLFISHQVRLAVGGLELETGVDTFILSCSASVFVRLFFFKAGSIASMNSRSRIQDEIEAFGQSFSFSLH